MGKAVVCLTSAPPGSGKTYIRFARFIWEEWLPYCSPGVHWSNFPARMDPWEDEQGNKGEGLAALASKRFKISEEEVRNRVRRIPEEVTDSWMNDKKVDGPWNYFRDVDINGAHIAIDEAHNFFPNSGRRKHAEALRDWLAEIRHRGATVEFITQHPGQVCKELGHICGERLILTNLENEFEPIGGCRTGDWLELWAGLVTKRYVSYVRQDRLIQWGSGWKVSKSMAYVLDPWFFQLYDSYSAPIGGGAAGMGQLPAWKRFSRLQLLWWFYRRNCFSLSWRAAVIGFWIWLSGFGGATVLAEGLSNGMMSLVSGTVRGASGTLDSEKKEDLKKVASSGSSVISSSVSKGAPKSGLDPQLAEYRKALDMAAMDRAVLEERLRELQERLGLQGGAVMIAGDCVRFESGDFFRVGEVIDYGPFAGLRIVQIDKVRRAVRLSDGRLLRLGLDRRLQGSDKSASVSGVQTGIPRVGADGKAIGETAQGGKPPGVQRTGHQGSRPNPVPFGSDGGIHRSARGAGGTPGFYGNTGSEFDGGTRRVGGPDGGSVGSPGESLFPRTEPARFPGGLGSEGAATER